MINLAEVKADLGIMLSTALLNMSLFGLVVQQYYTYWTGGFNDRIYLKIFVNVQFALVSLQTAFMWHLMYKVFVDFSGLPPPVSALWSAQANSLTQLFIIIFANVFLVLRIHSLTKSLVQSLIPMFFSVIAYIFGMITITGSNWSQGPESYKYATSVVWYVSQTVAECLISFFLVHALLKARSGMQRSDSVVKYLVRNIIQIAALATIWSIAALVAWFWLDRIVIYTIFDKTSGTVYTHAIFETLISRAQLRDRMAATSAAYIDFGFPSTTQSQASAVRFPDHVIVSNFSPAPQQSHSDSEPATTLTDKDDIVELGNVPRKPLLIPPLTRNEETRELTRMEC